MNDENIVTKEKARGIDKKKIALRSVLAAGLMIPAMVWFIWHSVVMLWVDALPVIALAVAISAVIPTVCVLLKKCGKQYVWPIVFLAIAAFYTAFIFAYFLTLLLLIALLGWYNWPIWIFLSLLIISVVPIVLLAFKLKKQKREDISNEKK